MNRNLVLWAGVLTGPIVWFLGMEANFAVAPLACGHNAKPVLYLVSLVCLVLTALAGCLSWFEWQRVGRAYPGELGGPTGRSRAMAMAGVLLSAMFCLTIIAQAIPNVVYSGCE
jgi:hypothetical protein